MVCRGIALHELECHVLIEDGGRLGQFAGHRLAHPLGALGRLVRRNVQAALGEKLLVAIQRVRSS